MPPPTNSCCALAAPAYEIPPPTHACTKRCQHTLILSFLQRSAALTSTDSPPATVTTTCAAFTYCRRKNSSGWRSDDETLTREQMVGGLEVDLVTHDARKFFRLLLKKNGYVLEQVFSPLVVNAMQPQFDTLCDISRRCITRHHAYHYKGFAHNQWKLFEKECPRRIKPLLYVYRVLLTGIHLMRTGEVEANLVTLNEAEFNLCHVHELVVRKRAGAEQGTLADDDVAFHKGEFDRLLADLEAAAECSPLPEFPAGRAELNALLLSLRRMTG